MKKKVILILSLVLALVVLAALPSFAAAEEETASLTLWDFFYNGTTLSLIGAFFAVALSGIGSAKGVGIAGQTAAGVVAEDPSLGGKFIALEALPATQGIYGFVAGFLVMIKNGVIAGNADLSVADGMYYLFACLPIGVVGLISAIHQGKVAAAGMQMVAKQKDQFGKAITYAAVVETYAILALLISALLIFLH